MELYFFLAVGLFLLLAATGRAEPEPPQVIYVMPQESRGSGLLSALLGLTIFVALAVYLLGALPA